MHFLAVNKSRKHSCFEIYSYLKDSAFTAVKRNKVCKRGNIFVNRSRGGSRIFFRRGCTHLLLYFNTNKPHSFFWFFLQNTSCIRKQQVISGKGGGVCTPCTLPLDPPLRRYTRGSKLVYKRVRGWTSGKSLPV